MNAVLVFFFFCHLFLRFEHGWFCAVFVGLITVEDFVAISCINSHSFGFFSGVNGREYIPEM